MHQAPERFAGVEDFSPAIDLWAVGVVTMALVTGKIPWLGKPDELILCAHVGLIGAINEQTWPGHALVPKWPVHNHAFNTALEAANSQTNSFLERLVLLPDLGPLPCDHSCVQVITQLLCWAPGLRACMNTILDSQLLTSNQRAGLVPVCPPADHGLVPAGHGPVGKCEFVENSEVASSEARPSGMSLEDALAAIDSGPTNHALEPKAEGEGSPGVCGGIDTMGSAVAHCACSGNCGRKWCRKLMNARRGGCSTHQVICIGRVKNQHKYCQACECELEACVRPRNKSTGRWCCVHGQEMLLKPGARVDAFGSRKASKEKLDFQIVARLACILRFLVPDDLVEFARLVELMSPMSATAWEPHHWAWLFLGHTIQWAPSMRHWIELLMKHKPRTPGEIAAAYAQVIRWSSGHILPTIFRRMNAGRPDYSRYGRECRCSEGSVNSRVGLSRRDGKAM